MMVDKPGAGSLPPPQFEHAAVGEMRSIPGWQGDAALKRIAGFDGLRAIAFLLVFVSHKVPTIFTEMYSVIGVWLFFFLSGFLITRILWVLRQAIDQGALTFWQALGYFYLRRCFRILPVYYALLLAFAVGSQFIDVKNLSFQQQIAYWTFTTNFYVAALGSWIGPFGHFWTLAVEEQYYLVFAPLALLFPSHRLWIVCSVLVVIGAAANVWLVLLGANSIAEYVHTAPGFALFGVGGLAGLFASQSSSRRLASAWIVALAATPLMLPILSRGDWPEFPTYSRLLVLPLAVLLVSVYRMQDSPLVGVLEWKWIRELGQISYGAYLMHVFIRMPQIETMLLQATGAAEVALVARVLGELAVTVLLAWLSWRLFERPVRDFGNRKSRVFVTRSELRAT